MGLINKVDQTHITISIFDLVHHSSSLQPPSISVVVGRLQDDPLIDRPWSTTNDDDAALDHPDRSLDRCLAAEWAIFVFGSLEHVDAPSLLFTWIL